MNYDTEDDSLARGQTLLANKINELVTLCYQEAYKAGWHTDKDGNLLDMNKGERLMLIVTEVAEAMEGERKNLMDDHLPHRKMAEVEMADAIIRICDYCGRFNHKDLGGAIIEKMLYNRQRPDHKRENREKEGGKSF